MGYSRKRSYILSGVLSNRIEKSPELCETYGNGWKEKYVTNKHRKEELHSEIERISIMDDLPEKWTYPEIQPKLLVEAKRRG